MRTRSLLRAAPSFWLRRMRWVRRVGSAMQRRSAIRMLLPPLQTAKATSRSRSVSSGSWLRRKTTSWASNWSEAPSGARQRPDPSEAGSDFRTAFCLMRGAPGREAVERLWPGPLSGRVNVADRRRPLEGVEKVGPGATERAAGTGARSIVKERQRADSTGTPGFPGLAVDDGEIEQHNPSWATIEKPSPWASSARTDAMFFSPPREHRGEMTQRSSDSIGPTHDLAIQGPLPAEPARSLIQLSESPKKVPGKWLGASGTVESHRICRS